MQGHNPAVTKPNALLSLAAHRDESLREWQDKTLTAFISVASCRSDWQLVCQLIRLAHRHRSVPLLTWDHMACTSQSQPACQNIHFCHQHTQFCRHKHIFFLSKRTYFWADLGCSDLHLRSMWTRLHKFQTKVKGHRIDSVICQSTAKYYVGLRCPRTTTHWEIIQI